MVVNIDLLPFGVPRVKQVDANSRMKDQWYYECLHLEAIRMKKTEWVEVDKWFMFISNDNPIRQEVSSLFPQIDDDANSQFKNGNFYNEGEKTRGILNK